MPAVWKSRRQTLFLHGSAGSAGGTDFTTLVTSAEYTFSPAEGDVVTIGFPAAQNRFVRVNITANTGPRSR